MEFDGDVFVRQFIAAWDRHDLEAIAEMFTDDVVFETSVGSNPWGERAVGRPAARVLAEAFFRRMPDVRYELIRHFTGPEIAVVESRTTGTHAGVAYDVHLVDVLTLREGRIAAKRSYRKRRFPEAGQR